MELPDPIEDLIVPEADDQEISGCAFFWGVTFALYLVAMMYFKEAGDSRTFYGMGCGLVVAVVMGLIALSLWERFRSRGR